MSILGSLRVGSVSQIRIRQRLQRVIDEDPPPVHAQPAQSFKCHATCDVREGMHAGDIDVDRALRGGIRHEVQELGRRSELHVALQGEYLEVLSRCTPTTSSRPWLGANRCSPMSADKRSTARRVRWLLPYSSSRGEKPPIPPIPDGRVIPRAVRSLPLRRFPASGADGLGAPPLR